MKTDKAVQALEDMAAGCAQLAGVLRDVGAGAIKLEDPATSVAMAVYGAAVLNAGEIVNQFATEATQALRRMSSMKGN